MSVRWHRLERQRERELRAAESDPSLNPTSPISKEPQRYVLCVGRHLAPTGGWIVTTLTRLEAPVAFFAIGAIVHCRLGLPVDGLRPPEIIFESTENDAESQ